MRVKKIEFRVGMAAGWGDTFNEKAEYLLRIGEIKKKVTAKEVFFPGPLRSICSGCVTFKGPYHT
jgi:hypothetical protein